MIKFYYYARPNGQFYWSAKLTGDDQCGHVWAEREPS